jgi:hypothetical protein
MKLKCTVIGILLAASITPAFAIAEEDAYFIVRVPSTNKCIVVDHRPAETPNLIIGLGYKTKTEAEDAMKKVCAAN